MTWEPAKDARDTLARWGLSVVEGPGAKALAEYKYANSRAEIGREAAEVIRDAILDLSEATAGLDEAMRDGDPWKQGDALLDARRRLRRWTPRLVEVCGAYPAISLDGADVQLLEIEHARAKAADGWLRLSPEAPAAPIDDPPARRILVAVVEELKQAIEDRGRKIGHAGRVRDAAKQRLLSIVEAIGERGEQRDALEVPKIAAALLAVAGVDKSSFPSLVKAMHTAYRRLREGRSATGTGPRR